MLSSGLNPQSKSGPIPRPFSAWMMFRPCSDDSRIWSESLFQIAARTLVIRLNPPAQTRLRPKPGSGPWRSSLVTSRHIGPPMPPPPRHIGHQFPDYSGHPRLFRSSPAPLDPDSPTISFALPTSSCPASASSFCVNFLQNSSNSLYPPSIFSYPRH